MYYKLDYGVLLRVFFPFLLFYFRKFSLAFEIFRVKFMLHYCAKQGKINCAYFNLS